MGFLNDLVQAIRKAHQEKYGGVNSRLAKASEFDPAGLARFLEKDEHKKLEPLGRLADACGLRVMAVEDAASNDYAFIPRAFGSASAGPGAELEPGETERGLAYRKEWLSSRTGSRPEDLRLMPVEGDSMHPTLDHGDMILVDQGDAAKTLILDKIYVVRKGQHLYVKRYRRAPDRLLFMGDNRQRAYEDLEIRPEADTDFAIVGRVLWAGKEL